MKKNILYLTGLIAILTFSCIDENIVNRSGNELRITASMAPDSRVTFVQGDGVIKTHWKIDDEIGLFTDEQKNLCYKATIDGPQTEFIEKYHYRLKDEEGKTVYAYYPYHQGSKSIDSIYTTYDEPFLYAQAQIKNGELNFQFKHLFAYLRIVITAEEIKEQVALAQAKSGGEYNLDAGISIESDENMSIEGRFNALTHEYYEKEEWKKTKGTTLGRIESDSTYTIILPIHPQSAGTQISGWLHCENTQTGYDNRIYKSIRKVPEGGLQAGHVYTWDFVGGEDKLEENYELLKSFYEKTGGDQWHNNENWLSDKPYSEWYGIKSGLYLNYITSFYLRNNILKGPFPEEVADIMDQFVFDNDNRNVFHEFNLNRNYLYGPIPDKVKNHPHWNELGWYCVQQFHFPENELDLTNSNLYIEDIQVEDIFSDEETVNSLYEIFKKNKLTEITGVSTEDYMSTAGIIMNLTDERINLHLDYQSKGLHTLYFVGEGTKEQEDKCKKLINSTYGNVEGITWLRGKFNVLDPQPLVGYIFDSTGQLVYFANHNFACPTWNEELVMQRHADFLRSVLGEPAEHPEFESEIYTSTDYSRDGEVVTLQEATVGKGINLTFLGESFVDKDMEPGGLYEQTMREAMEQFFSYEPYKSFRNRFNVYAVKVVSPNSIIMEGSKQAINENIDVCFEYAQKIPNAELNPPMVSVIYRDFTWFGDSFGRSRTTMLGDGSFVSLNIKGIDDASVLMHESGGHGFGGLLDEYVESGYEGLTLPENKRIDLDNRWMKFGFGANVDWRNDASRVKWSHFLSDSRYNNEGLGLYEGAYLYSYGAYRPTENSMMRHNNAPFNAPSREQIYKRIMQRSEGESWTYDYEEFVKYDEINRKNESRSAVKPLTEAERKEYIKNHRPPTFIKGTWRDAMKNGKSRIVVPLR